MFLVFQTVVLYKYLLEIMSNINAPWDKNIETNLSNNNKSQNSIIDTNIPIYNDLVEQVARNVSGKQDEQNRIRGIIDLATNELKSIPNTLDSIISQFDVAGIQTLS